MSLTVFAMKHIAASSIRTLFERIFFLTAMSCSVAVGQVWTVLAFDAKGNGRDPSQPDAALLSYRYDKDADLVWFRIGLYGAAQKSTRVTIAVDTGSSTAQHVNWWGRNK